MRPPACILCLPAPTCLPTHAPSCLHPVPACPQGVGGFGAVHEATWRGKRVAIKLVPQVGRADGGLVGPAHAPQEAGPGAHVGVAPACSRFEATLRSPAVRPRPALLPGHVPACAPTPPHPAHPPPTPCPPAVRPRPALRRGHVPGAAARDRAGLQVLIGAVRLVAGRGRVGALGPVGGSSWPPGSAASGERQGRRRRWVRHGGCCRLGRCTDLPAAPPGAPQSPALRPAPLARPTYPPTPSPQPGQGVRRLHRRPRPRVPDHGGAAVARAGISEGAKLCRARRWRWRHRPACRDLGLGLHAGPERCPLSHPLPPPPSSRAAHGGRQPVPAHLRPLQAAHGVPGDPAGALKKHSTL